MEGFLQLFFLGKSFNELLFHVSILVCFLIVTLKVKKDVGFFARGNYLCTHQSNKGKIRKDIDIS